MSKGNKKAHGKIGNKGGTGRPPIPEDERKTQQVRMSPKLWDKIQTATMAACESDWHEFLEKVIDQKLTNGGIVMKKNVVSEVRRGSRIYRDLGVQGVEVIMDHDEEEKFAKEMQAAQQTECQHEWKFDGLSANKCIKCGARIQYNTKGMEIQSKGKTQYVKYH